MIANELKLIIVELDSWLDEEVSDPYKEQPLAQDWARVTKLSEEVGEAVDALIGYTGQNPRKGEYGQLEDLLAELADTSLTGMYAIQHFTKDVEITAQIIASRARYHLERIEQL